MPVPYSKSDKYFDLNIIYSECSGPGGIFGLGEPMHLDVPIPADLVPIYTKGGGVGPEGWSACFATVDETATICREVGFDVIEAGNAPDAWHWWYEFSKYDPHCKADPNGEAKIIQQDGGRWLTYGYVIARKPHCPVWASPYD